MRTVDEAVFVVTRGGSPLGTETFRVVAIGGPGAQQLRITAQRVIGDQRITSSLIADSLGTPSSYDVLIKSGKELVLQLTAHAGSGRLASLSTDQKRNESMKEYVVTPGGTVILDDDLYDQYFLIAHRRKSGALKVIAPRLGRETNEELTAGGMETIDIGGRPVTATKFSLGTRQFWVDPAGRLLRVVVADNVTATREELPR